MVITRHTNVHGIDVEVPGEEDRYVHRSNHAFFLSSGALQNVLSPLSLVVLFKLQLYSCDDE